MQEPEIRKHVRKALKAHMKAHGGAWWDFLNPAKNGVGDAFNKVKNEFTNPNSELRGHILPEAASIASKVAPFVSEIPIIGQAASAITAGLKGAESANEAAQSVGAGVRRRSRKQNGVGAQGFPESPTKGGSGGRAPHGGAMVSGKLLLQSPKVAAYLAHLHGGAVLSPEAAAYFAHLHGGASPRRTRPPTKHNLAVKALMARNPGLTLPEASKHVKEHGLAQ